MYKYRSTRAAVDQLVDLLDEIVPVLPPETKVVPVPTIAPHIRIRGYDHMALIASRFAARRGLGVDRALIRVGTDHQQGSSRRQRLAQAKRAFHCRPVATAPYLLIDDVYTTGATLHCAAHALREAGASDVYVAVLSRQLLEKS
jgi:predicted amidophosphoribosyltransferase